MIPKFRVWDKRGKEMWKVATLHIEDEYADLFKTNIYEKPFDNPWAKFEDLILMQSTGLKDKNGVEIFEGDIVKLSVQNGFDYLDNEICIVKRSIVHSGLVCATCKTDVEYRIYNTELFEEYVYEVIGNIYENPELLEAE